MVEYRRARRSFATFDNNRPRVIHQGDAIAVDDPAYVGREHLYESMEDEVNRQVSMSERITRRPPGQVEQTSAAPGERRPVRVPPPEDQSREEDRPVDYAPKTAWLQYARSRGYDGDDKVTKDDLIERYG